MKNLNSSIRLAYQKTQEVIWLHAQRTSAAPKGSLQQQQGKADEQTRNIHSGNKVEMFQNQRNYHWNKLPRKRVDSQGWMSFWKFCLSQTRVLWLHAGVAG